MLLHYGFFQVLRVEAYVQGTDRLVKIGEGRYPFDRLGDRHDHSLLDHLIECALYLLPVLDMDLTPGMLDRGNTGVGPDGIGPKHVAYSIVGVWDGSLQGNYVLGHSGRGVTLVNFTLRAGFGLMVWAGGLWCLRAGRGSDGVIESFLC